VLIVVEAGERSGALITAGFALDLGRTVAAVPGPIDSPRHVGSNRLLSQGAAFIGRVDDVLSIAGIEKARVPKTGFEEVRRDDPDDDRTALVAILNAVRTGASDLDDLARSTSLTPRELAGAISTLELTGHLVVSPGGIVAVTDNG
jgi:DNA processing protein